MESLESMIGLKGLEMVFSRLNLEPGQLFDESGAVEGCDTAVSLRHLTLAGRVVGFGGCWHAFETDWADRS